MTAYGCGLDPLLFGNSYGLNLFDLSIKWKRFTDFMSITAFLKKKISKLKNRFDVHKVPIMMQKDLETLSYLNKI